MTPEQYSAAAVPQMNKTALYGLQDSVETGSYLRALRILYGVPLVETVAERSLDDWSHSGEVPNREL
jgi:hypothetical protein